MLAPPNGPHPIFRDDGTLDRAFFDAGALAALDGCTELVAQAARSVYLPIDLMVVLLAAGHVELRDAIARAANGEESAEVEATLRRLALRVDRRHDEPPTLCSSRFSVGFTGILIDAFAWAHESGRAVVTLEDLARVVRWRVEIQESASVRWAIRELAFPEGDDGLFDADGGLRRDGFDAYVWGALLRGVQLSSRAGLAFLGTPHLIAAMCEMPDGILPRAAQRARVDAFLLRDELMRIVGARSPAQAEFALHRRTLTPRLARMIAAARDAALRDAEPVGERHVVAAFLDDGGTALELMRTLGVHPSLNDGMRLHDGPDAHVPLREDSGAAAAQLASTSPTLDALGRDLTADARAGLLPPVHGRDLELQRIINVLMRSEQRNPLLTGEAGVGKTALAMALAQRIADGTVPRRLANMRVVEIHGASLIGGTSYRGELEARIKSLLAEAEKGVILFLDEAHAVFAPRTHSGQPAEVPNHFKAALASGRIAVVAATTEAEYHRWIEQDPALRRRFERIEIPELSEEQSRAILQAIAPGWEHDYEIAITRDAIDAAIEFSVRYLPEQSLPDKAKKLLMDATIAAASEAASHPAPEVAVAHGTPRMRVVCREDVARQVGWKTGIPLERIVRGSRGWWVGLEDRLRERVTGQDEAVSRVCHALVAGRLGGPRQRRPQGVLLLLGSPGVGQEAIAEALAVEVFGSRAALLRIDMADFAEPHSIARLIGSPPGYVGYQDEDALVSPLRRRPSRVVLLQGFDLAHPRVQDRFLRLFQDGEITDTRGLRADATHAIFVLTVDRPVTARTSIGFGAGSSTSDPLAPLRAAHPELADRLRGQSIDVVVLRSLSDGAGLGAELFDARLRAFVDSVAAEFGVRVEIDPAHRVTIDQAIASMRDVREVAEYFDRQIVEPVTRQILSGQAGTTILLGQQRVPA